MNSSPWLRIKEAAEYAKISSRTIENWMKEGLKYSRVGRVILIKSEWIDEFIEEKCEEKRIEEIATKILEDWKK